MRTDNIRKAFFPEVLDSPFWGSWVWSDSDIAAQGMETPVETEIEFQDGTARVQIMSYQSLKVFFVILSDDCSCRWNGSFFFRCLFLLTEE